MRSIFGAFLLLLGSGICQNEIPDDLQDLGKKIAGDIPGLQNLDQKNVPSLEDFQDYFKEKCERIGGAGTFNKLEEAKEKMQQCIQDNFNATVIQEEVDQSRKTGSMDEVFAKYCAKTPVIQQCIKDLTVAFEPCLEEDERKNLKMVLNVTDSVGNFVCYKDGDRIAMFVAEGGVECLDSRKEELQKCANETLSHRVPSDLSINNLPLFVIDQAGCDDYHRLHQCVVRELEQCKDNTPANIVDALFKFIRRVTPCKNVPLPPPTSGPRRVRSYSSAPGALDVALLMQKLNESYQAKCEKHGGQQAYKEIVSAMNKFTQSVQKHYVIFSTNLDHDGALRYLCGTARPDVRSALAQVAENINACSEPKEAYLPQFGFDIFDSIFNFMCKNDRLALKQLYRQSKEKCFSVLTPQFEETCNRKIKYLKPDSFDAVVTKDELCSDLTNLKTCYVNQAQQKCPQNEEAQKFLDGFVNALVAPCAGCSVRICKQMILVMVAAIFVRKYFFGV